MARNGLARKEAGKRSTYGPPLVLARALGFEEYPDAMIALEGLNAIKMDQWSHIVGTSSLYTHKERHTRVWLNYPADYVRPALALASTTTLAPPSRRNPAASRPQPLSHSQNQHQQHQHQQQVSTPSSSSSSRQSTAQPALLGFGGTPEVGASEYGPGSPVPHHYDYEEQAFLPSVKEENEEDILFENELFASPTSHSAGTSGGAADRQNGVREVHDDGRGGARMRLRVKGASSHGGAGSGAGQGDSTERQPTQDDRERQDGRFRTPQDDEPGRRDERRRNDERGGGGGRRGSDFPPDNRRNPHHNSPPRNFDRREDRPPPRAPYDDRYVPGLPRYFHQNRPSPSYGRSGGRHAPYQRSAPVNGPRFGSRGPADDGWGARAFGKDSPQNGRRSRSPDYRRSASYASPGPYADDRHSRDSGRLQAGPSNYHSNETRETRDFSSSSHSSLLDRIDAPLPGAAEASERERERPAPPFGHESNRRDNSGDGTSSSGRANNEAGRLQSIAHIQRSWTKQWTTIDFKGGTDDDRVHILNVPKSSLPCTPDDSLLRLVDALDKVLSLDAEEIERIDFHSDYPTNISLSITLSGISLSNPTWSAQARRMVGTMAQQSLRRAVGAATE
ncbi:hypothetical protein JCM10296v2_003294 [Rhodotorula toruloides]